MASEAGDHEQGQVWRYEPRGNHRGALTLLYESRSAKVLSQPEYPGVTCVIEGPWHQLH